MAKITRKLAKIFASNAGGSGVAEFGSTADGTPVFTTDPDDIQNTGFEEGLAASVIAGTKQLPVLEEMNGLYNVLSRQIAYLFQEGGIAEYNTDTEYHQNSIVKKTGTYEIYGSKTNTNTGNALPSQADNTNWQYLGTLENLAGSGTAQSFTNEFRLTLTSNTPVTTSDVTGATTIYCTPYRGNNIALYDGTNWNMITSAQFSLALGTITSGKNYDVFCYDDSGTATLEMLVWTNDTTRATALAYQDGVLIKSGDATRRYLGTFRTTSTTTTEDSSTKRFLYNYNNRIKRYMFKGTTGNWNYTTATFRQANASASNQVEAVQGVAEDEVSISLYALAKNSSVPVALTSGIGIDSTTVNSALVCGTDSRNADGIEAVEANYSGTPAAGYHKYVWLEHSEASGTTTWYGTEGEYKAGIMGSVQA
ncbi:hypothetical protein [uncultured Paraglaciecola sp.]|uniref:hypothetical protein n=1 Tax=uncultured Paraglaciecola sp. TaxID=1765024 RepID=UPI0026198A3C|nr:hypothetical protein [uncultured Paraglaciecola sp.]